MISARLPILLMLVGAAAPAMASSSDWVETEGGRVRLVTAGPPDADGRLHGALDIVLKPGWKTYWRDPGDAGVPPSIDTSRSANVASATLDYPAPERHDEGDFTWAGYSRPVAFPVIFQAAEPGSAMTIRADVFLGICETICIPVKAELTLDPTAPQAAEDSAVVDAAIAAVPALASEAFGARLAGYQNGMMLVEARFSGAPDETDIFVASTDGIYLGTPKLVLHGGKKTFEIEVDGPPSLPAETRLHYTLVSGGNAVSGILAP